MLTVYVIVVKTTHSACVKPTYSIKCHWNSLHNTLVLH